MSKKMDLREELKDSTKEVEMKAEKEDVREEVVYMGPSIPNVVKHATVFKGGVLPDTVKKKVEEMPLIQSVFVPIGKLVECVKELHNEKSAFFIIYKKLEEEIGKERV